MQLQPVKLAASLSESYSLGLVLCDAFSDNSDCLLSVDVIKPNKSVSTLVRRVAT